MDPASATLAAVGLLVAFKGAVDSYVMLTDVFASDPGLNYQALLYNIEQIILQTWGEKMKLSNTKECLINNQPPLIQDAVGRTMAEIVTTLDQAGEWVSKKYSIDPVDPKQSQANTTTQAANDFNATSPWIAKLKAQRLKLKHLQRFSWVAKDKKHFEEINQKLATLNQKLNDLVGACNETRLVTAISDKLDSRLSLTTLSTGSNQESSTLLGLVGRLQSVQEEDVEAASARVKSIPAECIQHLDNENQTRDIQRTLASYQSTTSLPETVLLEWKHIEARNQDQSQLIKRIRALGALLSTGNAQDFHRLDCLGIFDDKDYEKRFNGSRRIALVYKLPRSRGLPHKPPSLLDVLKLAKKDRTRPPLGQRFELAYQLASAISLFHAAKWIHKSFSSDCVVFPGLADSIANPAIVGFQYSRPVNDESLETTSGLVRSELHLYIHPSVEAGWTKTREIYSLGIVLLEIAYWRPVFEEKYRKMMASEVAAALKGEVGGKFGQDLEGTVGEILMNAVRWCLSCPDEYTGSYAEAGLSTLFFQNVVEPLSTLKA
ncbi:prion-inhibition and propagation domain-containing protein [Fusarium sporotrichioides]|uniref:Prion-inhibition and propagation domain-containing protein n=1 Tax=Fusarium sporotrichioides TaxID=5514 RepID=A0A395RJI5_FUSSP|nr:prion-inhibition and propagation domain-containing protein [Fusarium sporotrichioides]